MHIERETIVVEERYGCVYSVGTLVHRAFSEVPSGPREMRLIPCIMWWMPHGRYRVADTHPTCIRCIATRMR